MSNLRIKCSVILITAEMLLRRILGTPSKLIRLVSKHDFNPLIHFSRSIFAGNPETPESSNFHSFKLNILKDKPRQSAIHKRLSKKTRRDTRDETSRSNILRNEISEYLEIHNQLHNTKFQIEDIKNGDDIIQSFAFRNRPQIILNDLEISYMTSEGHGLAFVPKAKYFPQLDQEINGSHCILLVPKTAPGDIVTVELLMHHYFYADAFLLDVQNRQSRNSMRNDNLIVCSKFEECSGCNYQMLSYDDQLDLKQKTIQKAFRFFYPEVFNTIPKEQMGFVTPSPMEYSYRTKLTSHYTYKKSIHNVNDIPIGFNNSNPSKGNVDISYCPIATIAVNEQLPKLRESVLNQLRTKEPKNSQSTLVLRESIRIDFDTGEYTTVCLTDPKKVITEKIEDFVFQFPANEFFQNNNSILPSVLDFVRYHLEGIEFKNIIDTYCGSGFFGISLSKDVPEDGKVFGIELAKNSLKYATHNAQINGLKVPEKVQFVLGSADEIFENSEFKKAGITGNDSIVIMDPSRKGSTEQFLKQLYEFKPKLIVYVSCNVFTQARDLATFMELQKDEPLYKIKDIIGFDFFPQTKHVESVAILELI